MARGAANSKTGKWIEGDGPESLIVGDGTVGGDCVTAAQWAIFGEAEARTVGYDNLSSS